MDRRAFLRRAAGTAVLAPPLSAAFAERVDEPASRDEGARSPMRSASAALTLFLAGDVMTGRGVDQVLPHSVDPTLHESWVKDARVYVELARKAGADIPEEVPHDYVWGDALEELARAGPQARLVNLETAVTASGEPWPGKGIHYRMHPANVALLEEAGIDAAVLANNHVLDWGRGGLSDTVAALEGAGIAAPGAGKDERAARAPAVLETGAGRLLIFALGHPSAGVYPEWEAGPERSGVALLEELSAASAHELAREVAAWRQAGDRVVVSVHWGGNWGYAVPAEQRVFARSLVEDGGADVVFGHSSHHPKAMEVHRGRLILYGAGDFLNDYEGIGGHEEYRGELTLMYLPRLAPDGSLEDLVLVPMRIQDFRVQRATADEAAWLARTLEQQGGTWSARLRVRSDGRLTLDEG